ncbi:MAG: hypothetical protein FD167_4013 [bacterium]|nr:MAG: hypothetical protein FD167_4013 [bacterium]
MAFSDYKTISQVQKEFGVKYQEENFIQSQPFEPHESFLIDLQFNLENMDVYTSEASRTEIVISPILREVYKKYYEKYSFWIQKTITYSDKLSGTPDYLIATKSSLGKTVLETPLIVIVEAKKNDFEQGWGQCLAELVAAQKINGNNLLPVYGVVTDGELWKFGKLIDTTFIKNIKGYTVTALSELFGAIDFILQAAIPK